MSRNRKSAAGPALGHQAMDVRMEVEAAPERLDDGSDQPD